MAPPLVAANPLNVSSLAGGPNVAIVPNTGAAAVPMSFVTQLGGQKIKDHWWLIKNEPPVIPAIPTLDSLIVTDYRLAFNFVTPYQEIMRLLIRHINTISRLIGTVLIDFKNGEEYTKLDRYSIWFDKWADALDGILYRKDTNGRLRPNRLLNPKWQINILTNHFFSDFIRRGGKFDPEQMGHGRNHYYLGNPRSGHKITVESLFSFFPELVSTFGNTFLYRVIDMKIGDKERKVTILNQKLPDNVKKLYKDLSAPISDIDNLYTACMQGLGAIRRNSLKDCVIGFVRNKSYLDHVKPHIGRESLLTCDINKFYNSVNLKNILDNQMFKAYLIEVLRPHLIDKFGSHHNIDLHNWKQYFDKDIANYLDWVMDSIAQLFFCVMSFYTCNGMLPTGSYASPTLSNILLIPFDLEMIDYSEQHNYLYTRYVDDICLSSKQAKDQKGRFNISIDQANFIESKLNKFGLFLKYKKTKIFGPNDTKVIANLNLPKNVGENPSIGTQYKLQLKEYFNDKEYKDLTTQDLGRLNWVKYVNPKQYEFIKSGIKNWPLPARLPTGDHTILDNLVSNYLSILKNKGMIPKERHHYADWSKNFITMPIHIQNNSSTINTMNI